MYNPDFDIDWHWAEFRRRAEECGMHQTGFVTHNSTSSHAMVPGIMEMLPYGLSDISATNINRVPMLSTGVRAGLGIKDWSEWHPCSGTRLDMMARILQYALDKGLRNVTCSEGFRQMGNRKSAGYFNRGYRFGMDGSGIEGTKEIYPHYVVSATDEIFYYNPLLNGSISLGLDEIESVDQLGSSKGRKFYRSGDNVIWASQSEGGVALQVIDLTGKVIVRSGSNHISLDGLRKGIYIVCAIEGGAVVASEKFRISQKIFVSSPKN